MPSDRVLVWLKPQYLGDAVMATPLLDLLAEALEQPRVLAGKGVCRLLADRTERMVFVLSGSLKRPSEFIRCVFQLRRERYSAVYLVNRSFRCALAARLAGIETRIGHRTEGRGCLLTVSTPYDKVRPEWECYLDLAQAAGLEVRPLLPRLSVTEEERAEGAKLFRAGRWIGVQPGARSDWKQLPIATLAETAIQLKDEGYEIALFGGVEEMGDAEVFMEAIRHQALNLVGRCDLRKTMGALLNLRMLIGSDTGLMHVAAAVGCPTLTVFGKTPLEKWGHNYEPHTAMQAPDADLKRVTAESMTAAALKVLARLGAP